MAIVKFRSGEGVIHEADESSMSYELMSKGGGFVRLDDETGEAVTAAEPKPAVALARLNKAQLAAEAEKRGLTLVADDMTKAQMIAAIDAAPTV